MRLMRFAALICCTLSVTTASSVASAQADDAEPAAATEVAPAAEADDAEAEAAEPDDAEAEAAEPQATLPGPLAIEAVVDAPLLASFQYRFLTRLEFERFEEETGFDATSLMSCREADSAGRRERMVTNRLPLDITITQDGDVVVEYTGEDDELSADDEDDAGDEGSSEGDGEDLSVQGCIDDKLEEMELDEVPGDLRGSRYRYTYYDSTYFARRRTRHGEITALYTLSGVSAAVAVGSLVAARHDDAEREEILSTVPEDSYQYENVSNRALRFRRVGWSMVGVSVASFVGATLLHRSNRDIEGRENPILVLSPGSPTGDLGFTLSGQF